MLTKGVGGESFNHALDALYLVHSIRDFWIRRDAAHRLAVCRAIDQRAQALRSGKSIDRSRRFLVAIVPNRRFVAVGAEDHRTLACRLFERVGIEDGLGATSVSAARNLLRFDDPQRFGSHAIARGAPD